MLRREQLIATLGVLAACAAAFFAERHGEQHHQTCVQTYHWASDEHPLCVKGGK